ncbi:hypothetical protein Dimus_034863 [Dionaea muscipula]
MVSLLILLLIVAYASLLFCCYLLLVLAQRWFRPPVPPPNFFYIGGNYNHLFVLYAPPSSPPLRPPLSPPPLQQPLFAFLLSFVVGLLQVKYQQRKTSPFDDHPLIMSTAVLSILIYFLAHGARSVLGWRHTVALHSIMSIFLSISYIALTCLLFDEKYRASFLGTILSILAVAGLFISEICQRIFCWLRRKIIIFWQRSHATERCWWWWLPPCMRNYQLQVSSRTPPILPLYRASSHSYSAQSSFFILAS